jgi:hypothetical protein
MNTKIDLEMSSAFHAACPLQHFPMELEEGEATVQGLLVRLSREYGEKMKDLLFEKGKSSILPGLMVLVNDRIYTGVGLNQRDVPNKILLMLTFWSTWFYNYSSRTIFSPILPKIGFFSLTLFSSTGVPECTRTKRR